MDDLGSSFAMFDNFSVTYLTCRGKTKSEYLLNSENSIKLEINENKAFCFQQ